MESQPLTNIGALDGRYRNKVAQLAPLASEYGLMRYRVIVECAWFAHLAQCDGVGELPALESTTASELEASIDFSNPSQNRDQS